MVELGQGLYGKKLQKTKEKGLKLNSLRLIMQLFRESGSVFHCISGHRKYKQSCRLSSSRRNIYYTCKISFCMQSVVHGIVADT